MSQLPSSSFLDIVPKALSQEIFARSVNHLPSNSVYYVQQTSKMTGVKKWKSRPSTSSTPSINLQSSSISSVYCQLCDKEGHLTKHCRSFLKLKKKQSTYLAKTFSACSIQELQNPEWFPDSGATSHMTNNPANLDDLAIYFGNERVMVGNGQSLPISHIGFVSTVAPYSSIPLFNVLVVPGIKKNLISITCSYTPSQNGVAERKHHHVTETDLTLMFHAYMPVLLWVEAFSTAVFLINRLSLPFLDGKTPYEILFGKSPDYSMLRTFGLILTIPVFLIVRTMFPILLMMIFVPISAASLPATTPLDFKVPSPMSSPSPVPANHHHMITRGKDGIFKPQSHHTVTVLSSNQFFQALLVTKEPKGFKSAAKHLKWLLAMDDKILTLKRNDTWTFIPWPPSYNVVDYRWIFKVKPCLDGSTELHKACLVAQGFSQVPGLDFGDTFSPVVRRTTVRLILSLAIASGWRLHRLDVNNAFLHGFLNEELGTVYLLLYVDDIVLTSSSSSLIHTFITRLSKEFSMKDLGDLHYFLRVEVKPNEKAERQLFSDPTLFRSLAGALQYLTITRPDLSFYVNSICQFMHTPTEDYFRALKCILRYVKSIVHHGFQLYKVYTHKLLAYSDADWAGCPDTLRSTTRYVIFLGANLISWSSKKQSTVSRLSAKAEYRSLAVATAYVVWLTQLLRDLQVPLPSPPYILCDNQSAIFMAINHVTRPQSKHIIIDYHFIRELIANGSVKIGFVPSHLQLADSLIEGVTKPQFFLFRSKLSVLPSPTFSLQGVPIFAVSLPATTPLDSKVPSPMSSPSPLPANHHHMITRGKAGIFKPQSHHVLTILSSNQFFQALLVTKEPKGFKSAAKHPKWFLAMDDKILALKRNNTWTFVPWPPSYNVVDYRCPDGSTERHKACLVAQDFSQVPGLDFGDTFSPVVRPTTVRLILSLAIASGWRLHQLDVNNAFLHGFLNEEVYMEQPLGYIDPLFSQHFYHLKRALYGLKQALCTWFHCFDSFLHTLGFHSSLADSSLFVYHSKLGTVYLLLYVDDIVLTSSSSSLIHTFITRLSKEFSMKDLGDLHYFLKVEVQPNEKAERQLFSDPTLFRSLAGALQYLTITRPDLLFYVNSICQFMHTPIEDYFRALKCILRYVKSIVHHGLQLHKVYTHKLLAYSDADWAGCPDTLRSTTRYVIFLGANLISWSSKKQSTVSRLSAKAEYRSLAVATAYVVWLTQLLRDLQVPLPSPPYILCDNQSAIFMAINHVTRPQSKHIIIDYHFIRELIANGSVKIDFVPSHLQLADSLIEGVIKPQFFLFRSKLSVLPSPTFSLQGVIRENLMILHNIRCNPFCYYNIANV
ncbi:PREDICTED: uncharacterized protein LOC105115645 [Populus euphratica]|uniref:Uncharacterized protein LOC105115645 n=1 Tax=Populus euphratica TaxID=75702 RepID=A0AAJ6TGW5_POPEU|nr:PREDICTED: uncharacterized protein LOC105115645 [Populus euphratica]